MDTVGGHIGCNGCSGCSVHSGHNGHRNAVDTVNAIDTGSGVGMQWSGNAVEWECSGVGMQWSECIYAVDAAGGPTQ